MRVPSKLSHDTGSKSTKPAGSGSASGCHATRAAPSRHSQSDGGSVGAAALNASVLPSGDHVRSVTMPRGRPVTTGRSPSIGPTRSTA